MWFRLILGVFFFIGVYSTDTTNEEFLARNILQLAFSDNKQPSKKKDEIAEIENKQLNKEGLAVEENLSQPEKKDRKPEESASPFGRCDINLKCPHGQYCDDTSCFKCLEAGEICDLNGVCCEGSGCQYGVCTKGVKPGTAGTFCDVASDCTVGEEMCCILEISVNYHHSVCKPLLDEHESCGPINLFHQTMSASANNDPVCGPCKKGLSCKGVGILGRHSVCLPENETK